MKPATENSASTSTPTESNVETFRSDDGLVRIHVKSKGLLRWPQHDYPCVLLELRPAKGARVTRLHDGSHGLEAMLRHSEIRGLLAALNAAAGRELYASQEVKDKPPHRRQIWAAINHARHARA